MNASDETNGNGKVARAEVEGLEKRFEDCRLGCLDWRHGMEDRVRKLENGYWVAVGIIAVIQFAGVASIVMFLRGLAR